MTASRTFQWKPALMGARYEVRVDEAGAIARRGSREQKVCFADVTGGRFLEIAMRTSSTSLVLFHRNGKFVINHGGLAREAAHSEEAGGFVEACVAILDSLARVKPDLDLSMGGGPGIRWTMAILGLTMAGLGALIAIVPFGQGGMDAEGVVVIVMAIATAFGGLGLAGRYNPLRTPPAIKAGELAVALRAFLPND